MQYAQHIFEDTVVFQLAGDLIGEESGQELLDQVSNTIQKQVTKCIIDIADVRYINSSGIGTLIAILTKFRNKGGEVVLLSPSESVQKLLIITKLNAIFNITYDMDEAHKTLIESN